jgi:hypothetical protein
MAKASTSGPHAGSSSTPVLWTVSHAVVCLALKA